jgi:hypothetical protein
MSEEVQNAEVAETAPAATDTALSAAAANTQAEVKTEESSEAQTPEQKLEKLYDSDKSEASDEQNTDAKTEEVEAQSVDYEALTVPEGFELDQGVLDKAKPVFAELGIDSQEGVQKLVNLFAEVQGEQAAEVASSITARYDEWLGSVKAEWGSDYESNLGTAVKAVKGLGGEELIEALNITGAGNHPAIIKAFHKVGSLIGEDQFAAGDSAINRSNPLDTIYPSMKA